VTRWLSSNIRSTPCRGSSTHCSTSANSSPGPSSRSPRISRLTLFAELRQEFGALAIEKGLDLRVEDSGNHIHSDPSLIEEILRNLIANAIKYTRKGWVQLRCRTLEQSVQIEVLDTGIGIPPNIGRESSTSFISGYVTACVPEGYGLGLSIVQRIAALLNVSLEVRSEVGHGSVFSITVPAGVGNGRKPRAPRLTTDGARCGDSPRTDPARRGRTVRATRHAPAAVRRRV